MSTREIDSLLKKLRCGRPGKGKVGAVHPAGWRLWFIYDVRSRRLSDLSRVIGSFQRNPRQGSRVVAVWLILERGFFE